jgi:hypothetical protein
MSSFDLPQRFRFSLRGMLIAVALVAMLIWLSTIVAGLFLWITWSLLFIVLPTPLVVAAVYARGDIRAFSIGALIPWISSWSGGPRGSSLLGILGPALWLLVLGLVCGLVAVASRRWIDRSAGK